MTLIVKIVTRSKGGLEVVEVGCTGQVVETPVGQPDQCVLMGGKERKTLLTPLGARSGWLIALLWLIVKVIG
jgi:hypothetical protein